MRLPPPPGEYLPRYPPIGHIAQESVGPFDAGDFVQGLQGSADRGQTGPLPRNQVRHGQEIGKPQRLVVVEPAPIPLPVAVVSPAQQRDSDSGDDLRKWSQDDPMEFSVNSLDDAVASATEQLGMLDQIDRSLEQGTHG